MELRNGDFALSVRNQLPEGFMRCRAEDLHTLLPEPTLISLPGQSDETVFVSVLLHGNETTGLLAVQQVLDALKPLPRKLLLFIGNVQAARFGLRRLDGQPDFNRIWAGGELAEHRMAQAVLNQVAQANPVAAIDIHNNTGRNPLYACINHVDRRFVQLARRFSDTIVFFSEPHQVIANNVARYCVSVTLECGRPGAAAGVERSARLLEHCLSSDELFSRDENLDDVDVFHTVARMTVADELRIGFGEHTPDVDLRFPDDFDSLNFRLLDAGTTLGERLTPQARLKVQNDAGHDVSDDYIGYEGRRVVTRKMFLPSMLTLDERVIHQDCLGYIMEHYPLTLGR